MINNRCISDKYSLTLRNKFNSLQEISKSLTLNNEYENFVNAHIEEAAECNPTKLSKTEFPSRHEQLRKNVTTWKLRPNAKNK